MAAPGPCSFACVRIICRADRRGLICGADLGVHTLSCTRLRVALGNTKIALPFAAARCCCALQGGRRACHLPRNGGVGVRVGPRHDHVLPTCWVGRPPKFLRHSTQAPWWNATPRPMLTTGTGCEGTVAAPRRLASLKKLLTTMACVWPGRYFVWQLWYVWLTEVRDKERLVRHSHSRTNHANGTRAGRAGGAAYSSMRCNPTHVDRH